MVSATVYDVFENKFKYQKFDIDRFKCEEGEKRVLLHSTAMSISGF